MPHARFTAALIRSFLVALLPVCVALDASPVFGVDVDYVNDVRPILQQHCYSCHGEAKQKSGLRLDIKSEAFRGGDGWGQSVVEGDPDESPLIELVTSEDADSRMPPGDQALSAAEIETLTKWVSQGAVWPDGVDLAVLENRLDHWSFTPPSPAEPPAVSSTDWPIHAIDRFVLSRLEQDGLHPAPPAEPIAWLRRVTLDLTGLPPSDDDVINFQQQVQHGDAAYAEVVERLLQSPRYGERWAQHWLDVVRYADTHGFEVNTEREHAWPYRDYVIESMNADTPYDQFIKEQIVGDALGQPAATGFLVTASVLLPGQIGQDEPSKRLARQDSLDEIVTNVSQSFLGLSVGCARCHDHKFDPITAKDYYSMQAFVAGVEYDDRELPSERIDALKRDAVVQRQRVAEIDVELAAFEQLAQPSGEAASQFRKTAADQNVESFEPLSAKFVRFTIQDANRHPTLGLIAPCIDELEVFTDEPDPRNVALASLGTVVTASGSVESERHRLAHINDGLYGNSHSWISDTDGTGWVTFELPTVTRIAKVIWGRDREGQYTDRLATAFVLEAGVDLDHMQMLSHIPPAGPAVDLAKRLPPETMKVVNELNQEKKILLEKIAASEVVPLAFAGKFRAPDEIHLLNRGDPEQPQQSVSPAVLSALGDLELMPDTAEQERRRQLADWIASPENPMTARVMVNRIWQWHFGTGFVDTPNDFGRNGSKPTHPQLLDWLALEFIRSGWSLKHMHRIIVTSATYRQSTQPNQNAAAIDADARLLWRYPSRRLEAEAIRDCMLSTTGRLNLTMGGRGFNLFNQRGGLSGFTPVESFDGDGLRRMIYAHKVRRERDAVFGAFDCPDGGQSAARRIESTTPIQALNLFNSRFTIEQSDAFAEVVGKQVGGDVEAQVKRAYSMALNRDPDGDESAAAVSVVKEHGLPTLCRALFNSNEFLFYP